MKIYAERFCTRPVIILLIVTVLFLLHFVVHQYEHHDNVKENNEAALEAEKNYRRPEAEKVTVLAEPIWSEVIDKDNDKPIRSTICFVVLVHKTEGFYYRNETKFQLRPFTPCVLFIQMSSVIDKQDKNTVFVESGNFFNPWAVIIKQFYPKIKEIAKNFEFLAILDSKTAINTNNFKYFEHYLLEQSYDDRILTIKRETSEVQRNPEKPDFVPRFLEQDNLYPENSPNDNFIVFPLKVWNSLEDKMTSKEETYYPIGIFFQKLLQDSKQSEIGGSEPAKFEPGLISTQTEVGWSLCKFNDSFAVVGYERREQITETINRVPPYGYFCMPIVNYHVPKLFVAAVVLFVSACCCCQCLLTMSLLMAGSPSTSSYAKKE